MPTSPLTTLHQASRLQIINMKSNPSPHYERTYLKSGSPAIPSPALFEPLSPENIPSSTPLPTIGECAVHLELLQVFNSLRLRVLACNELDDIFGIKPDKRTVYRRRWSSTQRRHVIYPHQLRDVEFAKRRLEKWPHYLGLAVTRFKTWVKMVEQSMLEACEDGELTILPPLGELRYLKSVEKWCSSQQMCLWCGMPFC